MLPEHYKHHALPKRGQAKASSALLWLSSTTLLVVYLVGLLLADWRLARVQQNPLVGLDRDGLLRIGATSTQKMVGHQQQWWRILSSPFVSAGAIHLWASSSCIWTFGNFLSSVLKPWTLAAVYLLSGFGGVLVSANASKDFVTAGASGPAFGLIGSACAVLVLHWKSYTNHAMTWVAMALVLALNLFIGATPFVDNSCNIAGFVIGVLLTSGVLLLDMRNIQHHGREGLLRALCILCLGSALAIGVITLVGLSLEAPAAGCCDDLVCTPSRWWDCDAARLPGPCTFAPPATGDSNSTLVMICSQGGNTTVSATLLPSDYQSLCRTVCDPATRSSQSSSFLN